MIMVISEEVKNVIEKSAFLVLVTVNADGTPHPIVAGKGTVEGDSVVFGVYKMEQTRKNIGTNSAAQVLGATLEGGPKGFRLTGTAKARENGADRQLVVTVSAVDVLL
jgi:predicted pyridoxine 5'-phosphate oxidase superfamily flavin-nucleotide-binding protein